MDIFVQSSSCWASEANLHDMSQQGTQVNILSKDGEATSLPLSVLISGSPHLKSILTPSCCSWFSSPTISISLPSASVISVQLLVQILCQGESEVCGGLESTIAILGEINKLMKMLGIEINLAPVLYSKIKNHASQLVVVKENCDIGETSEPSYWNEETFDINSNLEEFYQAGIIKDCEVNLERCRETVEEFYVNGFTETQDISRAIIIKCDICGISLPTYQSLRAHIGEVHGFQDHTLVKEKKYRSGKNTCPICSLKFSSWGYVMKHYHKKHKEDSRGSGYQCKDCDMKCNNIGNLQRHRQARHKEFVSYDGSENVDMSVTDCGLIATNQEILSPHCQDFHHEYNTGLATDKKGLSSQFNILKCEECRQNFLSKSGLKIHIERHHEGINYGCGDCDYIAGYRTSLRKHCRKTGHNSSLIRRINP